jgi:DNA-binding NarL/FixJ family response regulator
MSIRVLIVDDQMLVRTGFRMILESEPDIEVVGEASDGREAIKGVAALQPDVVLMDVRMPNMDGLEATRHIVRDNRVKVLMLTTFDMDEYVYESLRAGASGFLLKDAPAQQLITGVRAAAEGQALLAPSVTRLLIEHYTSTAAPNRPCPPEVESLTQRELDVLTLISRGLSNTEIADQLLIGETTVKTHVARVLTKLGLRDRVQIAIYAYEHAIVRPANR